MTRKSNSLNKLAQIIGVALVVALFIALGFWQLQRAADLKQALKTATVIDTNTAPLENVTQPRVAIPATALNRTVSVTGKYIGNFQAPNQKDGNGKIEDWEVALMQVNSKSAILVVRGLWSERLLNSDIGQSMDVEITGLLVASQEGDRAENSASVISRLDSAVVVSRTDLDLFDGYIVASTEQIRSGELIRTRVVPEKLTSRIPGFYWQHLSYVVIWWLMAAVVVFLPFYRRRVTP